MARHLVTRADKAREFPSLFDFDCTGTNSDVTLDTDGIAEAFQWAQDNNSFFTIPPGVFLLAEPPPPITKPIGIIGVSPMRSMIKLTPEFAGEAITIQNCGFGDESVCFPINGNTAWVNGPQDLLAGAKMQGFSIIGDRSLNNPQTGFLLAGNIDHLIMHDLGIFYTNGRAIWGGVPVGTSRGQIRESDFSRIRVRHCGNVDSTASVSFYLTDSLGNPTADASNLFTIDDLHIVFPYGRGLEFVDQTTTVPVGPLYGIQGKRIMLHGRHVRDTRSNGALLHIEGMVQQVSLDVNFAFSDVGDYACRLAANPTTGQFPSDITINANMGEVSQGIDLQDGSNINWNVEGGSFVRAEMLNAGGALHGPVAVKCTGDACFVATNTDFTLNGVNPVVMPNFRTAVGVTTFMATQATNGTGDIMRADIGGWAGTITRTGSVTAGTDAYTFKPDFAGTDIIRAGTWASKFVIGSAAWPKFSGRFRYAPIDRYGMESTSIKIMGGGALKFAVSNVSGNLNHTFNAQVDGNLIMASYDLAGVPRTVWSIFAHFDGGPLGMNLNVPLNLGGAFNSVNPLKLGAFSMWLDTTSRLRILNGTPTTATAGTVVGSQS